MIESFHHQWRAGNPDLPVLLMLHGTGGDESSLLEVATAIGPEHSVLSPRGQVLENGHPRFFRRFAEGDLDLEDLVFRVHELADWLKVAQEHYGFKAGSLIPIGYSNGANVASSLLLLHQELVLGCSAWRPMAPLNPESTPDLRNKKALLIAGERDRICPPNGAENLLAILANAGAEAELVLSSSGHELTRTDITATKAWLESFAPQA